MQLELVLDMVAIVNTQEGALLPDFFGSDEQEVIANEAEIPSIDYKPNTEKLLLVE